MTDKELKKLQKYLADEGLDLNDPLIEDATIIDITIKNFKYFKLYAGKFFKHIGSFDEGIYISYHYIHNNVHLYTNDKGDENVYVLVDRMNCCYLPKYNSIQMSIKNYEQLRCEDDCTDYFDDCVEISEEQYVNEVANIKKEYNAYIDLINKFSGNDRVRQED